MNLRAEDITIAVTIYRRLEYLEQALDSAVYQTVPVKVRLYDDGCQDLPRLQKILDKYGGRVEYHRHPKSLGLFGNMNACLQQATTPWVSILHDDDLVSRDFVERILEVAPQVDRCSLFCGGTIYMTPEGQPFHWSGLPPEEKWRRITPEEFAVKNHFAFPGQLIHAPTACRVGCFPTKSIYTGDWELWFNLAMVDGVVQLGAKTGYHRGHLGADRGTTTAAKSGRKAACVGMQVKRNFARLKKAGSPARFDRREWVKAYGPLYRDLLVYSPTMPKWLLRYNRKLLLLAPTPGRTSKVLHFASRVLGTPALRVAGRARSLAVKLGVRMPQTF
jgi:glycosyltransferase involved in cell wall biosynthesis